MISKLRSFLEAEGWKLEILFLSLPLLTVNLLWKEYRLLCKKHSHQLGEWINEKFCEGNRRKGKINEKKGRSMAGKDAFVISYPCHYQCYRYSSSPVEWNNLTRPILQYNRNDTLHHLACTVRDVSIHSRIQLLTIVW